VSDHVLRDGIVPEIAEGDVFVDMEGRLMVVRRVLPYGAASCSRRGSKIESEVSRTALYDAGVRVRYVEENIELTVEDIEAGRVQYASYRRVGDSQ
jgi:hypothetical protein